MAFVRKELVEIIRQPRLLLLLVVGPFLLLLLFGLGYSEQQVSLRTTFVGPASSVYEDAVERYADGLDEFVESQGYVNDEAVAMDALDDGRTDVVVIFPPDPVATVLGGERATIRVLHDEIDPLQESAIEIASRLAVQELNATVLARVAGEAQGGAAPARELVQRVGEAAARVEQGGSSREAAETARDELSASLAALTDVLDGSIAILGRLEPDASGASDVTADLEEVNASARTVRDRVAALDADAAQADVAAIAADARTFAETFEQVVALDPEVLVRPFESDTATTRSLSINPTDYFTPASLALLLQHLALTFAALSLVRDRKTGLFELLRIGPLSSSEILIGKTIAYLLLGLVVAAALVSGAVYLLGVPFEGSLAWLAVMVVGVLLASLALGMVLSVLSASESQAVQFAMLSLLAGLFFSGFILSIDELSYPVKVLSWLLPVTYGIRALQDVMLRGEPAQLVDLAGVAALTAGYGLIAVLALRRRLHPS